MFLPINVTKRNFSLTGRIRFSRAYIGCWRCDEVVTLEVEEKYEAASYTAPPASTDDYDYKPAVRWRAATPFDLAEPPLRWLVDSQPPAGP